MILKPSANRSGPGFPACLGLFMLLCLAPVAQAQPDPATVYAWFRGDDGLGVGGDLYAVQCWTNHGAQVVTGISQAARDLSHLMGKPRKTWLLQPDKTRVGAVAFDGNDGLWGAKQDFGSISTNRTVIVCARVFDNLNQGFLFDAASFSPGLTRAQVTAGSWHVGASGATNTGYGPVTGAATAPAFTNVWQVHAFIVVTNSAGPRFRHFINGALASDVLLTTNGSLSGLMLGANVAQKFGIRAEIAEVLVFQRALDSIQRNGIEHYLTNKWFDVVADPNAPPQPDVDWVTVFEGGKEGYACYRIPALVAATKGTLIAVADGRISSCGDIPTPLDLVAKRSYDNGRTWTPLQVIANYGSNPTDTDIYPAYGITDPIPRVSGGDAALLLDRTDGRVWVLYDNGGSSNGRKIKLELRFSDDDGTNWSPAIDIEALNPGLRPSGGEFLAGPGNGIQLSEGPLAGRLIFPVYQNGTTYYSTLIFSDDHGQTWRLGGNAGQGGGEVQMAETAGGGLLASMRDSRFSTAGVRTFSRSADGGLTWSEPYTTNAAQPALPDPGCQGSILRLTTTNTSNASRLVFANAADAVSRVKMTLRLSYDEGNTWPVSHVVYAGSSAYSSLTRLASDEAGLLFEVDNYTRIDFVRSSVRQISDGSDSLPPYTAWSSGWFSPAQLCDPTISGPDADPDQDTMNNHDEFIAGTQPLNAASVLALSATVSAEGALQLSFMTNSNKTYTVLDCEEPGTGEWQRHTDIEAGSSNSLVSFPASMTNASRFFRVTTPRLP